MTLTRKQLEDIFFRATLMVLGLDPDSTDESIQSRVRFSWPNSGDGNSTWANDENVIFLRIEENQDEYATLEDSSHQYDAETDTLHEVVEYYRCFTITWVCYGPDAMADADAIRVGILRNLIKDYLEGYNLAILPKIREPIPLPELDDSGEWFERHDLQAQCYSLCSREYDEGMIETPPNISIIASDGVRLITR